MTIPTIRHERMSDIFQKYHIEGLPFSAVIHRFSEPDTGDPHDHPFDFTTHILSGGYVEKIYFPASDGTWYYNYAHRLPGTCHKVKATHIHQVVELIDGECFTLILPEPNIRKSGVWQFNETGYMFREWDQPEFKPVML